MRLFLFLCYIFNFSYFNVYLFFSSRFLVDFSHNPQIFYRGLHVADDESKILYFASERVLNIARQKAEICIQSDATFKTLPKMEDAYQLFIINYRCDRKLYSMVYAIMQRKTYLAYKKVFEVTRHLLPNTIIVNSMSDYEQGRRRAIREVYPSVVVNMCYFHYVKAVKNYADEIGLPELFRANNTIKCAVKYATCLALLPQDAFAEGISVVEQKLTNSPRCRVFVRYLRQQWLHANVSVFGDLVRTNNGCEALHRRMLELVGRPHPDVFSFLKYLQRFDDRAYFNLYRSINNITPVSNCETSYVKIDFIISRAQDQFRRDRNVEQFLSKVSNRSSSEHLILVNLYFILSLLISVCVSRIFYIFFCRFGCRL